MPDSSHTMSTHAYVIATVVILTATGCQTRDGHVGRASTAADDRAIREALQEHPLYRQIAEGKLMHYKPFTEEFLERIRKAQSPNDLRAWGDGVLDEYSTYAAPVTLDRAQIPQYVRSLDPPQEPVVIVVPQSHVIIDWGGGWGHWGVLIQGSKQPVENRLLYLLEWAPRLWAYHTLQ